MKENVLVLVFNLFKFYKMRMNKFDFQNDESLAEEVRWKRSIFSLLFWIFKFSVTTRPNKDLSSSSQVKHKQFHDEINFIR